MARVKKSGKSPSLVTRNFVFAVHMTANSDVETIIKNMRLAHRYKNKLVEIELKKRDEYESTLRRVYPEYAPLADAVVASEAAVESAIGSIKKSWAKARCRVEATPEQLESVKVAKAELKRVAKLAKDARNRAKEALDALQKKCREEALSIVMRDPSRCEQLSELNRLLAEAQEREAVSSGADKKSAQKEVQGVTGEITTLIKKELSEIRVRDGVDSGDSAANTAKNMARAESGLAPGTIDTVKAAASSFGSGSPPKFKRWDGFGTVSVWFNGGATVSELMSGENSMVKIHLVNEERLATVGRDYGKKARSRVQMRVSKLLAAPLIEFDVTFHRPLPADGVVKQVHLHKECVANNRDRWFIRFAVEFEPSTRKRGTGVAAIHIGSRRMPDGAIRVATVVNESGVVVEELLLPWTTLERPSLMDGKDKADSLRSIRDRRRDQFQPFLVDWLRDNKGILPEWLAKDASTIHQWRSLTRLANLCRWWGKNRFDGDGEIYRAFALWLKNEQHLYDWECGQREHDQNRRDSIYRNFARRMAETYEYVVLADINYAKLREKNNDIEDATPATIRRLASVASPGLLAARIREAVGSGIVVVKSINITAACHSCGHVEEWNRHSRMHTCTSCGERWDQDHNAAKNQLVSGLSLIEPLEAMEV